MMSIFKWGKWELGKCNFLSNGKSAGKWRSQDDKEFHASICTLNDNIKGKMCLYLGITYIICVNKYIESSHTNSNNYIRIYQK